MDLNILQICTMLILVENVVAQVSTLCRANERFQLCGECPRTCRSPEPRCRRVCKVGCYCDPGLVRNDHGACVPLDRCPQIQTRTINTQCPNNEEYRLCEPCPRSCDNPNPICPAQCKSGCFCKGNMLRNRKGQCVTPENCGLNAFNTNYFGFSKASLVKEMTVEDCASDEVFLYCGWCEATCSNPKPSCPKSVCTTGCLCRPPLVRHHSGRCVEESQCRVEKCSSPNEEYICKFGCEKSCNGGHPCPASSRKRCTLDCHCRLGYMRDSNNRCVLPSQCGKFT